MVTDSVAVPELVDRLFIRGEVNKDCMLILLALDSVAVRDSTVVIVVDEILLSIAGDVNTSENVVALGSIESEAGNSVMLRSNTRVACEDSTVLSDSVAVGVAKILELSLMVASNTKLVGILVGGTLSKVLAFALLVGDEVVIVGGKSKVAEGVIE